LLHITSRLKRVKYARVFFKIILFPIRFPLILLRFTGELATILDGLINRLYRKFEKTIVMKFNLDDLALKRYKEAQKNIK
jgi:hypothetical protein